MVYRYDRLIFLVDLVYHLPIYFFRLYFVGDIDHDFFYGHYNQPVPTFLYPHDDATLVPVYFYLFPNWDLNSYLQISVFPAGFLISAQAS